MACTTRSKTFGSILTSFALALAVTACGADQESALLEESAPSAAQAATDATGGDGAGFGPGGDPVATQAEGCTKVDFLFVVDNSASMRTHQDALIASFPGFISTIQEKLKANSDYHIMVVDTDEWGRCDSKTFPGQTPKNQLCTGVEGEYVKKTTFEECDRTLGAGVVHPAGAEASNRKCELHGGNRYIVGDDPDIAKSFACAARVGVAGHASERPMDAMVAALSSATRDCNAGFLRDDAILVVTFISDDPLKEDAGTPQSWYDAVVEAKKGNAESVVVLGLTPNFEGCKNQGLFHWSEFVSLWGDRGMEASICEPDYTPFFSKAVSLVEQTCNDFKPVR